MSRIGFVGPVPPDPGGVAQHGLNLISALRSRHSVRVVSWRSAYPRFRGRGFDPEGDVAVGVERLLTWWNPLSWYRAGKRLRGLEVVVMQYVHPLHGPALATIMKRARPTPAVVIVHNASPHEWFPFQGALARWAMMGASRIVAHSAYIAGQVAEWFPGHDISVVHHPPNFRLNPVSTPPLPPLRILFLGYVRPYKAVDICIEAVRVCVDRGIDVELTIAGEFWSSEVPFRQTIDRLGISNRVRIRPGYVPDHEVADLLAAHHAVVAAYRSASQSGMIPVAFACGRPVVVSDVGGLREQVEHGVNGVVVAPDDVGGLADGFEMLRSHYSQLQLGATKTVPSWESVADEVVRLLPDRTQA